MNASVLKLDHAVATRVFDLEAAHGILRQLKLEAFGPRTGLAEPFELNGQRR